MKHINRAALCATDSLGRRFEPSEATPQKRDRKVGIFYFMCHVDTAFESGGAEYFEDVLDSYDVESLGTPDSPFYDYDYGIPFYWGKPLFGCYRNNDEWVLRRHVEMLTLADVDFIVIDSTNNNSWVDDTLRLMKILDEGLKEGVETPKVAFYTNTDSGKRIRQIYDGIYAKGLYPETWFMLGNKPVIIGNAYDTEPELIEFFHFKDAQWPNDPIKESAFPWIDFGEQRVYARPDGSESVMSVSVAQNSDPDTACFSQNYLRGTNGSHGRSYHNGDANITEDSYKYGYNFSEQWENAREKDPDIVFITGWNEWTAGVWNMGENNPVGIFDCLNPEYSRDIEPMEGGFGDAYYQLLIDEVRKYKGIEIENTALPIRYDNFTTASVQRNTATPKGDFKDNSLRNVITACEVSADGDELVFSAETSADIDCGDRIGDWMRLYVDPEKPDAFCYCFNMRTVGDGKTVAAKRENGRWIRIGLIDHTVEGNRITLRVPRKLIGDTDKLYFKWVDSRVPCHNGDDFYLYGSVAPLGRLYFKVNI